ncbi:MAG: hypothetical protein R2795_24980 [Saprospiraceae bacterium]
MDGIGDTHYRFSLDSTGALCVRVPVRGSVTEYKINRGSWHTVETRLKGTPLPNRIYQYSPRESNSKVVVSVGNWYDLSVYQFSWIGVFSAHHHTGVIARHCTE